MPGTGSVTHVQLSVPNLEAAARFYSETLGLTGRPHSGGTRRFAAPDSATLGLEAGKRGLARFAIGVSDAEFRAIESRVSEGRKDGAASADATTGRRQAVTVSLPGDLRLDVCRRDAPATRRPVGGPSAGSEQVPRGIDHVTLTSADVKADAEYLRDTLGFELSAVEMIGPRIWGRAFARLGGDTHDVALVLEPLAPATRLHHVAWRAGSVTHVTRLSERIRAAGYDVAIDVSPGLRGKRAAVYVRDPAGHRLELATAPTSQAPEKPISLAEATDTDIDALWPETHPRRTG